MSDERAVHDVADIVHSADDAARILGSCSRERGTVGPSEGGSVLAFEPTASHRDVSRLWCGVEDHPESCLCDVHVLEPTPVLHHPMAMPFARIIANAMGVADFDLVSPAKQIEFMHGMCQAHDVLAKAGYGDYGVWERPSTPTPTPPRPNDFEKHERETPLMGGVRNQITGQRKPTEKPVALADEEWSDVIEWLAEGLSTRVIGRRLGVSHQTVWKWQKRLQADL